MTLFCLGGNWSCRHQSWPLPCWEKNAAFPPKPWPFSFSMTKVKYIFWETECVYDVATLQTTNIYNPGTRKIYHLQKCHPGGNVWSFAGSFVDTFFSTPYYWVSGICCLNFFVGNAFQSTKSPALNKLVAHFGGNKSPETLEKLQTVVTWNHAYPNFFRCL